MARRSLPLVLVLLVLALGAGCGKDLTALKTQALGLVDKYKPQLQGALTTVEGLLGKAKALPAEVPGVSDLVGKLTGQQGALAKLQGLLDGLPGQAEALAKGGKEEELKKLVATVDTEVGGGVKAAEATATEAKTGLEAAEGAAKKAAMEGLAKGLADKLGAPLGAALDKLAALAAKVRALPPETAGQADLVKAVEALEADGAAAKKKLDDAGPAVLGAADAAAAQALVDATTTEVDGATKKLEAEVAALEAKLGAPAPAPAAEFTKTLSTGVAIAGNGEGVEAQLIAFIEDATKEIDKTTWFDFDRLTFASGSAALDVEASKAQLDNIVAILAAFPNAKLKIGGYTDNVGAADANKKISQQRADAVVKALVDAGVAPERLEAEGYGPEHPVCPANDTDECKAQNRRIAVRVTAK